MDTEIKDWLYQSEEFQNYFQTGTRSLILKANSPYFTVLAVSDKYLSLVHKQRSEVINNNLFDVFPGSAADPSEKNSVFSSFKRVIDSQKTDELPVFKYEIFNEGTGASETEYWTNVNEPILDKEGNVAYLINTTTNITQRLLAEQAFEETGKLKHSLEREQELNEELGTANEELRAINEELHDSQSSLSNLTNELEERVAIRTRELEAANEEQRVVNEELLQAQNDYLAIFNQLEKNQEDLLFTIDAANLATFDLNPATGKFRGNELLKIWFGVLSDQEIEAEKAIKVIKEEDRSRVRLAIEQALQFDSGGRYDIEYTIVNPQNVVPRIVKAKGKTLFNDSGEAIRLSGVMQDITEQKKDEQRKNDFIGMVSHEMKTPLTTLSAYLQLLQLKANKEDNTSANMLTKANLQVSKITKLINGFLNVSRLESGKIHIDKQRFDMAQLIREVKDETISMTYSHKVIFAPVEETFVNADRDKIGQVINNLISNAIKYSPDNTEINIACASQNNTAVVSVRDEGIGIKDDDKPKLFERYYRVNDGRYAVASGFGIGLYLCCEIIRRHNGKIWVESEVGKGSTFSFSLPVTE